MRTICVEVTLSRCVKSGANRSFFSLESAREVQKPDLPGRLAYKHVRDIFFFKKRSHYVALTQFPQRKINAGSEVFIVDLVDTLRISSSRTI